MKTTTRSIIILSTAIACTAAHAAMSFSRPSPSFSRPAYSRPATIYKAPAPAKVTTTAKPSSYKAPAPSKGYSKPSDVPFWLAIFGATAAAYSVNAADDTEDCDFGDWLEGDEDCKED